jgi:hypothetical protein
MSFKDVLDTLSVYLLKKHPPKCLFPLENAFEAMFKNIGLGWSNKIDTILTEPISLSCKVTS